jgi:hypothetical protein
MASEQIQEAEHLDGSEREKREMAIKEALGSLFQGEPQ